MLKKKKKYTVKLYCMCDVKAWIQIRIRCVWFGSVSDTYADPKTQPPMLETGGVGGGGLALQQSAQLKIIIL